MNANKIELELECDTSPLELALEKAHELERVLEHINELSEKVNINIDIDGKAVARARMIQQQQERYRGIR
ncbi:MAG: hypothetical protein DUD32_04720 [Lactobacillus sp.]|nr:MAG: hypothetical protein DUD32_04720 [Lactobacillus sp.]